MWPNYSNKQTEGPWSTSWQLLQCDNCYTCRAET